MSFFGGDEAEQNQESDTQLIEDQDKKWGDNRVAVNGEWLGLVGDFGGQYAPPAILEKDGFEAMTHQQIWDLLQDVNAGLINDKALAWRSLADLTETSNQDFLKAINDDLDTGWNGQSATAAVNGVREFSNSLIPLVASFRLVAHSLDLIETYLGQAKASVGEPDNVTTRDQVVNILPDDFFKTPQYRADEAQDTARRVMTTYYEPGAGEVDRKTPVLPEPVKPVDDGTAPQDTGNPQGTTTTNGNSTDSGTPTDEGPNQEEPGQQPTADNPQSAEPQSTTPQSATPEATTPQSTTPTTPSLTTGAPTAPGTPGLPAGTPSGAPSGTPQTTAPLVPGQTVPGGPGKPGGTPATTAAANTGNRAGRTGMPGMMSPGAARGNRDDDDEHEIPDYLIYDRGSELLGTQPPALPPGGVIGG